MNLVWFLTIASFLSLLLGEFGHYPFGASGVAISLTDILVTASLTFLLIWQIGIKKKIDLPSNFKWLACFFLTGSISLIVSKELQGGLYLIRFVVYSGSFYLGYSLIRSKVISLEHLLNLILISAVLLSFIGFFQLIFFPDLEFLTLFGYDPHKNRLVTSFLDPNFAGCFLSVAILAGFYLWTKKKNKLLLALLGLLTLATILTFSRSAYLMLFLELVFFGLLKLKKILLLLVIIFISSYLLVPRFSQRIVGGWEVDKSAIERINSWQNGLAVFRQNPLLGIGFNNLRSVFERENLFKVFSQEGGHSGAGVDSSLIFVLATTGIIGLIVYLFWWVIYLKSIARKEESAFLYCLILGLLANSFFINSLFYPPVMLVLYSILGAVDGQNS